MNEEWHSNPSGRFQPLFLARLIWQRKSILGVCAAIGVFVGLLTSITTSASYQVYMIVGPAEPISGSSSASGLMGDLAALSGINLSSPTSAALQKYHLLMTGTRVAAVMEKRYRVLRELIPDAWNGDKNRWKVRDELDLGVRGTIKEWLGMTRWREPDAVTLAELLSSKLMFTEVRKSDFQQVTLRTGNPAAGVKLLDELHRVTNEVYMDDLADQTKAQVEYIDQTLRTETRENVRASQIRLLDQYANQLIMLHSGQSLFVQYVQPPMAGSNPVWPKPTLMVFLGLVIGIIAGLAVAVLWPLGIPMRNVLWSRPLQHAELIWGRIRGRTARAR